MNPLLKILGLMSGTSLDGLDIALVEIYETRGNFHIKNTAFKTYPYENDFKTKIFKNVNPDTAKLEELCELNFEIGNIFAQKIQQFCNEENISLDEIDLIGSHGQTFYHNIRNGKATSTLQLGDPAVIAVKTGITTIGDFRPFDIASGGEGAPLVPFVDNLLFGKYNKSLALQNIGGIANVTFVSPGKKLTAFDTGPGNMIIDGLVKIITNDVQHYDTDGKLASKGTIDFNLLNELLNNEYFNIKPPKSTGRELFGEQYSLNIYEKALKRKIKSEDLITTVTYFVANTIIESYKKYLPVFPDEIIISGGGSRNLTLLKYLRELLPEKSVIKTIDEYGISSDGKEAVSFAVLAYCTVFGIPNNLTEATGARENVVMGKICPSTNYKTVLLKKSSKSILNTETTETSNLLSEELDELSTSEIVELMNKNDYDTITAVENAKSQISVVLDTVIESLGNGGKLFYIGAGTSGRLGVLDASECPPTFKTSPELVKGIIAGGETALTNAVEGAEDSGEQGRRDINGKVLENDVLIGISANGKAPYVISALEEAKNKGAKTVLITCNNIEKLPFIEHIIFLNVGPEVLSGSTRLKAGTVTKMVLNIITTGSFAKLGKVYGNYMVDLKVSNIKLRKRAVNIIKAITGSTSGEAETVLNDAKGNVKDALLMKFKNIDFITAQILLDKHKGFLRKALNE